MARLVMLLFLVVGLFIPLAASEADLIRSRSVLEDAKGVLTVDEASRKTFTPMGPILSRGFTRSVYWVRLVVVRPPEGDEAVLHVRQPYLGDVRLYEPDPGAEGGWRVRTSGSQHPFDQWERPAGSLGFNLRLGQGESTVYLRVVTTSTLKLTVEGLTPAEATRREAHLDVLEAVFVATMGLVLLWALRNWIMDRQRVFLLFVLHQAAYTLFGVGMTGYLAPLLPGPFAAWTDVLMCFWYCAGGFTILLFGRAFLEPYEPGPRVARLLRLLCLLFPLLAVPMALGQMTLAARLCGLLTRLACGLLVLAAFTARREQVPRLRTVRVLFTLVALLFLLHAAAGASMLAVRHPWLPRTALLVHGMMLAFLLAMALDGRSRYLLLMNRQAALDLEARSRFLALVSHEIRTPLHALLECTTLARRAEDPARHLALLEASSRSLMDLVNNVLDLSRMEIGQLTCQLRPVDIRSLLLELSDLYGPLARSKGLAFRVEAGKELPPWGQGDPLRIRQILSNLLDNAIKYTSGGTVACEASAGARGLRLEVRDTGPGLSREARATLFQPFGQGGLGQAGGGAGLGLAIVHRLASLLGGVVQCEGGEGRGTRFLVDLPFPAAEAPAPAATGPFPARDAEVLVVDDQESQRLLVAESLHAFGLRATLAVTGAEALERLTSRTFDLVLLDLRIPGMDGADLARRIRLQEAGEGRKPVPLLALTAETDPTAVAEAREAGIQEILSKPLPPEALARALARHLPIAGDGLVGNLRALGVAQEGRAAFRAVLLRDAEEAFQAMESALAREDREAFVRAAHALKGLGSLLSDPNAADMAAQLHREAREASRDRLAAVLVRLRVLWAMPSQADLQETLP